MRQVLGIVWTGCLLLACMRPGTGFDSQQSEMLAFSLEHIHAALPGTAYQDAKIQFVLDSVDLGPQAYDISAGSDLIRIAGGDERGLMYGGLEVAEQLKLYGRIEPQSDTPYLLNRGLKLNIPLDSRTPSYDDSGDAARQNIKHMWSWEFWTAYLDRMALNRYNVLSLWNPHPFPSMIKLDAFPEVALDDVCQTTYEPNGFENEMGDPQLVASNVLSNLDTIIRISIDEKILFWQKVMQYAKDRGIDIYWITWNICPNSVALPVEPGYKTFGINMQEEAAGKHGITHQIDNPITLAYHRAAVKQFLLTYPLIKGLGATAGEHMPKSWEGTNREQWLWESYGLGILDAKKEQPGRVIPFIHRVWHSDMEQIMTYWGQYPDPFEVSFKYAKARLYSSPNPRFHLDHVKAMKQYDLRSWWNLRNDDIFVFRWANTAYVRSFLKHLPQSETAGFMMGSDGYVWGREFIAKEPKLSGELEWDKHWMKFMLWGRLAYSPDLNESVFVDQVRQYYDVSDDEQLYQVWQQASTIIPLVNTYHWHNWDADWAVESSSARPRLGGFLDVFDFVENPTMERSNMLSPKDFVLQDEGLNPAQISPLAVADSLLSITNECLGDVADLASPSSDPATIALLDDIASMSHLGTYYAHKIRCAVEIARFRQQGDVQAKKQAIREINLAQDAIRKYAASSRKHYVSQMMARTIEINWDIFEQEVERETQLVQAMN